MLIDIFAKRYSIHFLIGGGVPEEIHRLFVQVAHVIFSDLARTLELEDSVFRTVHDKLARELGSVMLGQARSYADICGCILVEPYDRLNDAHGTADSYFKQRISLIELLLREIEEHVANSEEAQRGRSMFAFIVSRAKGGSHAAGAEETMKATQMGLVRSALNEINARFREARTGLHYHRGFIQLSEDTLTEKEISDPFWTILDHPMWNNVEVDIKEAIDRRDNNGRDPVLYAAKALESTIKIISDKKGWTTGKERGASRFIDNLLSRTNGRYLEDWEGEILKTFFAKVRNPHGHGPGSQPMPSLTREQTDWAIHFAMIWIRSLVSRL
jgi:hypothetical protein